MQGVSVWLAWPGLAVCGPFTVSSRVGTGHSLASASATLESAGSKPALQWQPGCVPVRRNALHAAFNSCLVTRAGLFPGAPRHAVCGRRSAQSHRKGRAHACRQPAWTVATRTRVGSEHLGNTLAACFGLQVCCSLSRGCWCLACRVPSSAVVFCQLPPCQESCVACAVRVLVGAPVAGWRVRQTCCGAELTCQADSQLTTCMCAAPPQTLSGAST